MSILNAIPAEMADGLRKGAETLKKHKKARIISHYDADGISSAIITRETLRRLGIETKITIFPTLSTEQMVEVEKMDDECIVMSDLGTSYLDRLAAKDWDIIILDHHRPKDGAVIPKRDGFVFVNPLLYGIDGSNDSCGSAVSYLFSVAVNERNSDLAVFAVSGMWGDRQHMGGMKRINGAIIEDAIEKGVLTKVSNLAYPCDMTFHQGIMSCLDPFLPGTTGVSDKTNRFVKSCELSAKDSPLTVSQEKIDEFAEALGNRMRRLGMSENIIKETFNDHYYSPEYEMDAATISGILDGCGRLGEYQEAFNAAESKDFTFAETIAQNYTDNLLNLIDKASRSIKELKNIQYFFSESLGYAGNIASSAVRYFANPNKPVIGITVTDRDITDLSSRATHEQVARGVNLADALRDVCASIGGQGGGHNVAAGGTIPKGTEEEFIRRFDEYVGRQIGHQL